MVEDVGDSVFFAGEGFLYGDVLVFFYGFYLGYFFHVFNIFF